MLAKRHIYELYRKNNLDSNEWGEVVATKEVIKTVSGGTPHLAVVGVNEDKYSSKVYGIRLVVDEVLELTEKDLYISNGVKEWRIVQIMPYETFFNKTMVYLDDKY
jgi:hypothetical protein